MGCAFAVEVRTGSRADLVDGKETNLVIAQIPSEWSPDAMERAPELAQQFAEKVAKLQELNERRKELKEKVEGYRRIKELVGVLGEMPSVQ